MKVFKLTPNTDGVDIDQKCLGISAQILGEKDDVIYDNRGLHIQIRHNGSQRTFFRANELNKLLLAAPEILEVLKQVQVLQDLDKYSSLQKSINNIVKLAEGK